MVRPLPRFVRGSSAMPPGRLRTIRGLFFLSTVRRCRTTVPGRSVGGFSGRVSTPIPNPQIQNSKITVGFPPPTVFKYWVPMHPLKSFQILGSICPPQTARFLQFCPSQTARQTHPKNKYSRTVKYCSTLLHPPPSVLYCGHGKTTPTRHSCAAVPVVRHADSRGWLVSVGNLYWRTEP